MRRTPNTQNKKDIRQARAWEVLARANPLWAVCTNGKRRIEWDFDEFMATGEQEVAWAFAEAKQAGILPKRLRAAVDFGCGPGRLSGALAKRVARVIGVDVSPTMLALARKNHPGDAFHFQSELQTIPTRSADLAYSTFVLQHLSGTQVRQIMGELARILQPGGLFIFQFPQAPRLTAVGIAWRLLPPPLMLFVQRRLFGFPEPMSMTWAKPTDIEALLKAAGFSLAAYRGGLRYSPNWHDVWYFAIKPANVHPPLEHRRP